MISKAPRTTVFAKRLAMARERAGLTQAKLGVIAGLDPSVASTRINQYERGKHEPKLATAKRLAEALNVPAAFLYTDDELLAKLLLRWAELSDAEKNAVLQVAGAADSASGSQTP